MADTSGNYYGRASSEAGSAVPGGGFVPTPRGVGGGSLFASSGGPSHSPAAAAGMLDQGKIFVGGLSWQTNEESLRWHFEQYGKVVSVEVMRDRVTGDPRGFAFVVFAEMSTVDLVMKEANHEINHKIVDVKRAQARGVAPPSIHKDHMDMMPTSGTTGNATLSSDQNRSNDRGGGPSSGAGLTPEQQGNKVFVGGIPPNVDSLQLKELFQKYGAVADAIVMVDQMTNRSRCFGFVTFEAGSEGAQNVIAQQPIVIEGRNVEVKLATPKADQPRQERTLAGPKNVGLRAGLASTNTSGEYAGLAVAYGRNGWKAGYGSFAFGKAGWNVQGWETLGPVPEKCGFSFSMLKEDNNAGNDEQPPSKKARL